MSDTNRVSIMSYPFKEIEKKWQKFWEDNNFYRAEDFSKKPKLYILIEFPYPSGDGLHVGHCRSYSALDAVSRKKRMEGFNVLYPIGWDAFGLPTENYAIKTGIHPEKATQKNIANFKKSLKSLGFSFDWSREVNTTDPKYYKWTQWIFLKLFQKGLAYQSEIPINWCPSCKTGLANEEVVQGKCERCEAEVERREQKQWMLKITQYADQLIEDLEKLDYLEKIKLQQINWIGKSFGTEIDFKVENSKEKISVFTTRTDTLFGVTAIVLAPEHDLVKQLVTKEYQVQVNKYIKESRAKSEFERTKIEKEKTGVFTGSYCIHPVNKEKIPIWIGDYVIATYGGGAVMVVPAHDYRDYDFAKKYKLEIKEVVSGGDISKDAFVDYGVLINSGEFNGLSSKDAIEKITQWLKKKNLGRKIIQYKLRDWVFSRQHYWGEPIPIIHCDKCGVVPVPEKDLPVKLPFVEKYEPTGTGKSPLADIEEWVNIKCPKCKGNAKRETDTMPNWAGSNWYFMRYTDPENDKALADEKKLKYWLPVDWYNGGMEHTTLHLLYSRFIYKFLYDIGVAPTPEPYKKRTAHGMVLAEDGRKMSKSFGNVINPDDIVKTYGADTLRIYEMFMGPFDQAIAWSSKGVKGVFRFLERVWKLTLECKDNEKSSPEATREIHKLNKKINDDLDKAKFNTPIAAFMEFINFGFLNKEKVGKDVIKRMLLLLAPFAPHIAEELWERVGEKSSVFNNKYPEYEERLTKEEKVTVIVQINGKLRAKLEVDRNTPEEELKKLALQEPNIQKHTAGKQIKKTIVVKGKLVNFVVG
jgi:leucyl-tRNA synthetase